MGGAVPAHPWSTPLYTHPPPIRTPTFHPPAETPQGEAEATVGVEADGDLPGRVQLTLQLDGAAQGAGGRMRHLKE